MSNEKIEKALRFFGINEAPEDCDICEDGSVYHGLTQILPAGSVAPPWFINHYVCPTCGAAWDDEWDCMCDDECPGCGAVCSPVDGEAIPHPDFL